MVLLVRTILRPSSFRILTTTHSRSHAGGCGYKRIAALKRNTRSAFSSTTTLHYKQLQNSRASSSSSSSDFSQDPICELAASNLRFGPGATREVGQDCAQYLHAKHVVIFYDPNVAQTSLVTVM
jgi:hypothetical protein